MQGVFWKLPLSLSIIFSQNRANIGHLGERVLLQALLHEQNMANNREYFKFFPFVVRNKKCNKDVKKG